MYIACLLWGSFFSWRRAGNTKMPQNWIFSLHLWWSSVSLSSFVTSNTILNRITSSNFTEVTALCTIKHLIQHNNRACLICCQKIILGTISQGNGSEGSYSSEDCMISTEVLRAGPCSILRNGRKENIFHWKYVWYSQEEKDNFWGKIFFWRMCVTNPLILSIFPCVLLNDDSNEKILSKKWR